MSQQTAFQSIDFISENYPVNTGIIFFGGEPLLKKDLIRETIAYSRTKSGYFHYKVTTNGILLDCDFLKYANKVNLQVSISIDGNEQAHNTFRKFPDGKPTFEMKLASHIRKNNFECYQCHLAKTQISVAFDGLIYPCVQFVKDGVSNREYAIGSITKGIDSETQNQLYQESKTQMEHCLKCDYNPRCNNKCSCLSWQLTGRINHVSPVVCETERILIPIVDKLGEKLFKKASPMFIQKHYNAVYPILSMIEDMN